MGFLINCRTQRFHKKRKANESFTAKIHSDNSAAQIEAKPFPFVRDPERSEAGEFAMIPISSGLIKHWVSDPPQAAKSYRKRPQDQPAPLNTRLRSETVL